jgi:hypothetical protein
VWPDTGPEPLLPQVTAASECGQHGRCPAGMATRPPVRTQERTAADTAGHFRCGRPGCRPGSGHRGRTAASGVRPAGAVLREPVAGSAAAGGMQPAPVDAGDPGGQAAAELAADIGHRRPGERAGLLVEAEVIDLQPGHLALSRQQPMTAWATWSGSTPTLAQVS